MSIVTQTQSPTRLPGSSRRNYWLAAATIPMMIAPVWLMQSSALPGPLRSLTGLALVLLVAVSSVTDLSRRKIYNWTTYTAFGFAILINMAPVSIANHTGAIGLSSSLAGAAVCFALMLAPFILARGGAGDVKLATAIGALTGVDNGILIIAFAYITAAITIIGWTILHRGPIDLLSALYKRAVSKWLPHYAIRNLKAPTEQQNSLLDQPIPLAGFFAIATILVVFDAPAFLRSL